MLCIVVSENKVLSHPSTVDSITTSGGSEDHVSMGTYAARKAVTIVENVENGIILQYTYIIASYYNAGFNSSCN